MVAERQRNGISIKIFRRSPRRRYSGRNLSQHHRQWHSSIAIKTRFVLNLLCSLTVLHWKCLVGSMSISGEAYTIWKLPLSTSLHSAGFASTFELVRATDRSLKFVHASTFGVSRISESSYLVIHQSDQWTNDQDYRIAFGECHSLKSHTFAHPRLRANHHVLAFEETVKHSQLPISYLW